MRHAPRFATSKTANRIKGVDRSNLRQVHHSPRGSRSPLPTMSVPPVPEEMDRMVPPKMIANLTFGGAVLVQEDSGMLCSPMGTVLCEKQGPIDRPPSWPLVAQALRWPVHWPTPEMRCFSRRNGHVPEGNPVLLLPDLRPDRLRLHQWFLFEGRSGRFEARRLLRRPALAHFAQGLHGAR